MEWKQKLRMLKNLIIALALLLMPLTGCGIISVGYNYGDVYLRYTINSYADFNDAQKDFIRKQVDDYMRWHRKNMLPEYVVLLHEMQLAVQSGKDLGKDEIKGYRNKVRELYVKTLQPTVNPAAVFLSAVEARQIDELTRSFAKENGKQREKELSGDKEEQLRKRAEKTVDFMENLVGNFTDDQLEHIRAASYKLPYATALYQKSREDNQARLIGLMKQKNSKGELENLLSLWLLMPEKFRNPEEQELFKKFELASDEMIADVYSILNDRQKKRLLSSIEKYIDNFENLSRQ